MIRQDPWDIQPADGSFMFCSFASNFNIFFVKCFLQPINRFNPIS